MRAVRRAPPRHGADPRSQPRLPPPFATSMHPARARCQVLCGVYGCTGAVVCMGARVPCRTSHRGHTHTPAHPHWLHARAARQPGRAMHRAGGVACMHAGCSWRADHAHACPAVAPTPAAGAHLAHATITRCSTRTPTRSGHCSARARSMHDVWARNVFGCRRLPCPSLPGACKHRHSTTPSPPPPVDADAGSQ